ncbi:hypothetical protein CCHR01_08340 [Colletotrichum chrysophilum]|uniref:Uncharacterized protein n=1 Tax=Colletotrichum chrysophilum TaxID=1836956 RepID=A0AAD9EIR0_9PEZI|nr:hypothetical protein CCHR01_08340 [Colletotrichum chrysophilum]
MGSPGKGKGSDSGKYGEVIQWIRSPLEISDRAFTGLTETGQVREGAPSPSPSPIPPRTTTSQPSPPNLPPSPKIRRRNHHSVADSISHCASTMAANPLFPP